MDPDDPREIEPIRFGRAVCGTLAEAERREWWIANGRGGYAAGTIAGTLTRRYHGLLIAPVEAELRERIGQGIFGVDAETRVFFCNSGTEATGVPRRRKLSSGPLGPGLDVRSRRPADRGADLDGAGPGRNLDRLVPASRGE